MGTDFAWGEYTPLIIAGVCFVWVIFFTAAAIRQRDADWLGGTFIALVFTGIFVAMSFYMAHSRYDTLDAQGDLERAGYSVVALSVSMGTADVVGPDGCTFTRKLSHTQEGGLNTYFLTDGGAKITPQHLMCLR